MCGIVGIVGREGIAPLLADCLERLEYRGYDSCGVATLNSSGIEIRKGVGPVQKVSGQLQFALAHGGIGIAHTRWATHGGVSEANAHPHLSCDKSFAVVHNGILSNHRALRSELEKNGHRFFSETDTEVFAHLLEDAYARALSVEGAFVAALRLLEGSYAIAMISSLEPRYIFCARHQSPLLLGIDSGTNFVGSDVNAFSACTRQAILLEDGEYALLSRDGYEVRRICDERPSGKEIFNIDWDAESCGKDGHSHYMEKEIFEQPATIGRAMAVPQERIASIAARMHQTPRRLFIGVGTTYYVALYGQYLFARLVGEPVQAISSDESSSLALSDAKTMLLAISQSGETFDTLQALRQGREAGAWTAAIVNVPGSTLTRQAHEVVLQNSGPEISVISTKAAMSQMVLMSRLAAETAHLKGRISAAEKEKLLSELKLLPEKVCAFLKTEKETVRRLAGEYAGFCSWFFLGRGLYTPIALESALKMKEVTYLHAEGMQAGFLKHGTLALIDEESLSVFLVPPREDKETYESTISSVEEVRARRGRVIGIGFGDETTLYDRQIRLPQVSPWVSPLLHLVAAQLLAYETALVLGRNIDRPRSLAKSVTVA